MAVCRIYDVAGATLDKYDEVSEIVGTAKPDGALCHIAGMLDGRLQVIEVWESTKHIEAYMETLGPAMQGADLPEPVISEFEVHKLDWTS